MNRIRDSAEKRNTKRLPTARAKYALAMPRLALKSALNSAITLILIYALVCLTAGMVSCSPAPNPIVESPNAQSATGFRTEDGRAYTGAGRAADLERLKTDLKTSGRDERDRQLAASILMASIDRSNKDFLRVGLSLKEFGQVYFDFSLNRGSDGSASKFPLQTGKDSDGRSAPFELSLECDTPPADTPTSCAKATLVLKEKSGSAHQASIIVRSHENTVLARSTKTALKIPTLQRLATAYQTGQKRKLQTFEVAWGPSGFDLQLEDPELCPAGRLVETNDLDEQLRTACPGITEPEVSGRMIGNSTEGELLLEFNGTRKSPSATDEEQVYVVVQKPKPAILSTPTSAPTSADKSQPVAPTDDFAAPTAAPVAPVAQPKKKVTKPALPSAGEIGDPNRRNTGWLIPINPDHPATKGWSKDREHPAIAAAVKAWSSNSRLKKFAEHFLPNRDLVVKALISQEAPGETAVLLIGESEFFIKDGYPIQVGTKGEVGPWQFMADTAKTPLMNLAILPLITSPNSPTRRANPCDARADLEASSRAAGRYVTYLLKMFPRDPKLAILSYNWGEGNTGRALSKISKNRIEEIKNIGLNYWAVRKFNMAPVGPIQYVERFVAAHHALLEMPPINPKPNIKPWQPNSQCSAR